MTERKRFTPESLLEMRGVSDPQIAPDGVRVAYVEHWIEAAVKTGKTRSGYRTCIMLSETADGPPRRITWAAQGNDAMPRWSPDGRFLAFLSTREQNIPQLYVLDLEEGGEAVCVTSHDVLSEGIRAFDWHLDGDVFCFTSFGHKTEAEVATERDHDERIYQDRLPIKFDGRGLFDARRLRLWRVERDGSGLAQLLQMALDIEQARWSPTGTQIAFVTRAQREHEWTYINDLFVYDLRSRETHQLTASRGPVAWPAWNAAGTHIAYIGHHMRSGNATNNEIWVVDVMGGEPRSLTSQFDRSAGMSVIGDMHFIAPPDRVLWDGDDLVFIATDHGRVGLYRVPVTGDELEQISSSGLSVVSFTVRTGQIAFTGETNTRSVEVYSMTTAGRDVSRRSHAGDALAAQFTVSKPAHVSFTGAGGLALEGWVIKPTALEEGRRYPLLLYIHGGPHMDYGNSFFHEFQVLADAGFGVWLVNPRGARSYGEAFADMVRGHFGEQDYDDLMLATDLAAAWDWVDPQRLGVLGGSYGGYMTNWITSHTDRFVAACSQRCLSNLLSFMGTSDIGPMFGLEEFGGLPWRDEELLMRKSPIRYVANVKTPTLILHQENDYRCSMEQAEQWYTALVCLGVPTKFVRFPEENHDLSRLGQPHRRVNRLRHIVAWFDQYLITNDA